MEIIESILSQLHINSTIFYQLVIVYVLYFLARFVLLKPVQRILDMRIEKTSKTENLATDLEAKYETLKKEYDAKIDETYKDVQGIKASKKSEIDREIIQVYKKNESEVSAFVESSRKDVEKELESKKASILSQTDGLADELIGKLS